MSENKESKTLSTVQDSDTTEKAETQSETLSREEMLNRLSKVGLKLHPSSRWNPLLNYPRNSPCPCQSGKKFKKCHLNMLPLAVKAEEAETYKKVMAQHKTIMFTQPPIEVPEVDAK